MIYSMTGFAALKGGEGEYTWSWEIRSVNAKGLDVRPRVPDWIPGLEQTVKATVSKAVGRGNVSLTLRVQRDESAAELALNEIQLARVLGALAKIGEAAADTDLTLVHCTAADVLNQRGVLDTSAPQQNTGPLAKALVAQLPDLIADFNGMRAAEGAALYAVLEEQVNDVETLIADAGAAVEARKEQMAVTLRENLARVLDNSEGADPDRVAQELAMIAVKTDITEELDRLQAHVGAARDLLQASGPVGRKLDFLTQEFNREANTLCSKSQSVDLTRIGLDLKAVIDRMREQVQNVE
jgi:uncharacterized protein (TIGR00255 family)